ncbi:hypothetical protein CDAR_518831 [Caerostris darwini]|uniref:Uncharacterized protein n=1 Tax=Caerostris darwini TaxID=1538125 RepID=A0AAV4PT37_9ARAC|nr:hypothetical protein CDAR_518831 [Caerostris darwini]
MRPQRPLNPPLVVPPFTEGLMSSACYTNSRFLVIAQVTRINVNARGFSFNCLPCDSQVIYTLHRASFRDPSVCTHQYSQSYLRRKTSLETPPPSAITSRDACLLSMARRQRHLVKEKRDSHGLSREALKSTFQITLSAAFKKTIIRLQAH